MIILAANDQKIMCMPMIESRPILRGIKFYYFTSRCALDRIRLFQLYK